ncbi:DUF1499 domain-containing protein [uncultured Maricaulis sp.]|uniref:DUF1499 domain-containing protein n=1 Tax=uncultured Maricaulis sp. TaxID=174710 RepID=UPI00260B91B6|nr:DUF1499 domain-containing protein [uncultured Maricaulis sp.]
MDRLTEILRAIIPPLGWITALLTLITPVWFLVAALGTKLSFWNWSYGLDWMTLGIGPKLILACAVMGGLLAALVIAQRLAGHRWVGGLSVPVLALLVAAGGFSGRYVYDGLAANRPFIPDVTTDAADPPHFTAAYAARRASSERPLAYDSSVHAAQQAAYPEITSLVVDQDARTVFRQALLYGRENGWRIGTASDTAGMFEAAAESLMFGFRDDISVRVTALEDGRSQVDIRSLARQPVHDLGRNAERVERFLAAMSGEAEAG